MHDGPCFPHSSTPSLRHSSCSYPLRLHVSKKMLLGLTDSLPSLVEAKFKSAKASSSLFFSPTELSIIRTSTGIPASTCTTQPATQSALLTAAAVPTPLLPLARK